MHKTISLLLIGFAIGTWCDLLFEGRAAHAQPVALSGTERELARIADAVERLAGCCK